MMVAYAFCVTSYANANAVSTINDHLKSSMRAFIQKNHIAGAVVSYQFQNQKQTTLSFGYQNVEKKIPMSAESYFPIGSITKAFLSVQIMRAAAQHNISMQETLLQVAKKCPGRDDALLKLVKRYPHLGVITLRQYLTHTSGVGKSINSDFFINEYNQHPMGYWNSEQLIAIAMHYPPYFSPGTTGLYSYTNTDYEVMSVVLEALTKKTLYQNMTAFFHQVGLKDICYTLPRGKNLSSSVNNAMAEAYVLQESIYFHLPMFQSIKPIAFPEGEFAKNITPYSINFSAIAAASGGIIAQPKTLVQWYWTLFHGDVVTPTMLSQMLNGVPTGTSTKRYGLGIVIQTSQRYGVIYGHSGITYGYASNVVYVPKYHVVFAVAVNTSTQNPDALINTMVMQVLSQLVHPT